MDKGIRLDSWKEIAAHLGRKIRTCQQWERGRGLPVHRLAGSPRARVYGYTDELDAWQREKDQKGPGKRSWPQRLLAPALILLVVAIAGLVIWGSRAGRREPPPAGSLERLVVLPFENLGAPGDEYFADGLTDEITARITGIRQLEVIGRSTAAQYKGTDKTLRQIGEELDVGYVLSGTVRWQRPAGGAGQVRVTPSFVRVSDGKQLWAQSYDKEVSEIFGVQSDIALRVSRALKIALRKPERSALQARPTRDLAAHDYYLRGRESIREGAQNREHLATSIAMFEKAVKADPEYVNAYASLASSHAMMFWWFDHTEERAERARVAAEMAIELGPGTAEAHLALGEYYYHCRLDWARALAELQLASEKRPQDSEIQSYIGFVKRRQGKLDEAASHLEAAFRYDPRDGEICANLGDTYQLLRNYAESERHYRQAASLLPDVLYPWISPNGSLACLYLYGLGDTARLRDVLERAAPLAKSPDDRTWLHYFRAVMDICDGRNRDALGQIDLMPLAALDSEFVFVLKDELRAQAYGLMGDKKKEQDHYQSARIILSHQIAEKPEDPRFHSALGIACAGLGLKDEAVREASKATELRPVSREFWRGIFRVRDLARVYAMVGEFDQAFDRLEYLLSISGEFSVSWLKADPAWARLRSLPRFSALGRRVE